MMSFSKPFVILPRIYRCDGKDDCKNGNDEGNFCPERKCPKGQFQCQNKNCTLTTNICDGRDDCGNGADEHDECGKIHKDRMQSTSLSYFE